MYFINRVRSKKIMSEYNKRRKFLISTGKVAGFGLFAGAFSSVITSCEQDELPPKPPSGLTFEVDLNVHTELLVAGGFKVLTIPKLNGGDPVVIKHNADDTFLVIDGLCRHQNCNLEMPATVEGSMRCICHSATYSLADGKVIDNKGFSTAVDLASYKNEYNSSKKILTITS
jgi:nitrite reductase/ring-hydroxylating ferredoxin subunit